MQELINYIRKIQCDKKNYKNMRNSILGEFPEYLDDYKDQFRHTDTDFGWIKSFVKNKKEYCLTQIKSSIDMHYIESNEKLYILEGRALISVGNLPGNPEQGIAKQLVLSDGDMIERSALTAWSIYSTKGIPLLVRTILDPPQNPEKIHPVTIKR